MNDEQAETGTIGETFIHNLKATWRWQVFGNNLMVVTFDERVAQPSLRVRILSRIFFGSKWEKL